MYRQAMLRGDYGVRFRRGDPGFFGGLLKGAAKLAARVTPIGRVISTAAGAVGVVRNLVGGGRGQDVGPTAAAAVPIPVAPMPSLSVTRGVGPGERAGRGQMEVGVSPLGTVGVHYAHRRRRINPANAKAARRAIARIKGARKLLQSIESQLPKRKAKGGSAGVITAAEARRALRA